MNQEDQAYNTLLTIKRSPFLFPVQLAVPPNTRNINYSTDVYSIDVVTKSQGRRTIIYIGFCETEQTGIS